MKKILFALLLFSATVKAQDNEQTKVTVTIQARDCEFIGFYIAHAPEFEDLFDAMKVKFRVASPPSGTTNVQLDTIPIVQWLSVSAKLRTDPYAIGGLVFSRYDAALRAANNTYMTSRLDAMNTGDTEVFTTFRLSGRSRLRKQ
jgi:hypothetical protein